MPFSYFYDLSATQKRIYTKSDRIKSIPLKASDSLSGLVPEIKKALEENKRKQVLKYTGELCRLVCVGLRIKPLILKISARRPANASGELQGLYEQTEDGPSVLTVWMKTAAKGQVVAFKSFIRTVIHELCHHIDFEFFKLADSFHTEGFFKRESLLYKQIVPIDLQKRASVKKKKQKMKVPEQLKLF